VNTIQPLQITTDANAANDPATTGFEEMPAPRFMTLLPAAISPRSKYMAVAAQKSLRI
jgi:hypothetical protein